MQVLPLLFLIVFFIVMYFVAPNYNRTLKPLSAFTVGYSTMFTVYYHGLMWGTIVWLLYFGLIIFLDYFIITRTGWSPLLDIDFQNDEPTEKQ